MGVSIDAKLVLGWVVPYEGVKGWYAKQDDCDMEGADTWDFLYRAAEAVTEALPRGWALDYASPCFDGDVDEQYLFVTAESRGGDSSTLDDLLRAGRGDAATQAAEIAKAMGAENTDCVQVLALPHVW